MSSISAGTSAGTALVQTGDTSGALVIKTGGSGTTAATFNADQTTTFAGAVSAPSFSGTSSTATNLAGGSNGTIPYQSASGTTQMLAVGTSGQVLTSAGAGAPTWASAPAPVPTFTASGTISAAGVTIALNSDGTVSEISGTTTSFSAGTSATLPSNRTGGFPSVAYDPVNQKVLVLVAYSSYLMGYVGTISGTTITYGSEYQIVTSSVSWNSVAYDTANNKFVVLYSISNTQRAKVLTVSGTTISAGTEATLTNSAGYVQNNSLAYNPIAGKFVAMAYDGNNYYTSFWLLTISGTSITENYYPSSPALTNFYGNAISCNPVTGTVVMGGKAIVTGTAPYIYPITVSGSQLSVGGGTQLSNNTGGDYTTPIFFGSVTAGYGLAVVFTTSNTNGAILVRAGQEEGGSLVVGGTYSYGSSYSVAGKFGIATNPTGSNIVITWPDGNDGYAKSLTAYVNQNGGAVFGSINNLFTPANGSPVVLVYCENISKMMWLGTNNANNRYTTLVYTSDGYVTTAQSFIGFSTGSAASGASVGVSTYASVNSNVSGLTLGSRYNVTYTGTLTTSTTGFPFAGTAYGTTKIRVGV